MPLGQSESTQAKAVDPLARDLLNPDGTLKLDGAFSGTVDLDGWNVSIDPDRGPVFGAQEAVEATAPAMPAEGDWAALGTGGGGPINDQVQAVAMIGSDVYVGGHFYDADNIPEADYLAKWNGTSWSAVGGGSWGGSALNGFVEALAVDGTDLYAGGSFNGAYNGSTWVGTASRIAKWNGSVWSGLGGDGAGGGSIYNGVVYAIAADGSGNVYAGGSFTNVKNGPAALPAADHVAKFNGTVWSAMGVGAGGEGSLDNNVNAIAVIGTDVYVGGNFQNVHNGAISVDAADYVAMWNGATWSGLGGDNTGDGSLNDSVYALAADNSGNLYVGGWFTNVKNGATTLAAADDIAMWDGTDWSALGAGTSGEGALNSLVRAIAVHGSDVYVGGWFVDVDNAGVVIDEADRVAKWDGTDWTALGSDGSGDGSIPVLGQVMALATNGTNTYVGGSFPYVAQGGTNMSGVAYVVQWNGSTWAAMGDPQGSLTSTVEAIAVSGSVAYVGGDFKIVSDGGVPIPEAGYIAKWDGSHWTALGGDAWGGPSLGGPVRAIAISGSDVYVGGYFTYLYDGATQMDEAGQVARWDGTHWHALGSDGAGGPALPSYVEALAVDASGNLYVGGAFWEVYNGSTTPLPTAAYIAKWDGTDWSALGDNGSGGPALNDYVNAIAVSGSDVYVGGSFTNAGGLSAADHIAKWNGSTWSALGDDGSGEGPLADGTVLALAVGGSTLYAGGFFGTVYDSGALVNSANYLAQWDGSHWTGVGGTSSGSSSLGGPVWALKYYRGVLGVGGDFVNVQDGAVVIDEADYMAAWDGSHWFALGDDGAGGGSLNRRVVALDVLPGEVLVGGSFWNVNNNGTVLPYADYIAGYGIALPWRTPTDFDGDDMTDAAKYVSSAGAVYYYKSSTSTWGSHFIGTDGDYVLNSDFDGDGIVDPTKYVSAAGAIWYLGSDDSLWHGVYIGNDGEFIPGSDFDGDGKTDPAKYVAAAGAVWYLGSDDSTWHGAYIGNLGGGVYVPGSDFDGDGKTDPAKYVAGGVYWLKSSMGTWDSQYVGADGPYVPRSDYDGDGQVDPAKFVSPNIWYMRSSASYGWAGIPLGADTTSVVPGSDFDGDGITDPAKFVYTAPHGSIWYTRSSDAGSIGVYMGADTYDIVN